MKIGILTLPLHTNYGGILQAYALQTVLERMGHEVNVINLDRTPREISNKEVFTTFLRTVMSSVIRLKKYPYYNIRKQVQESYQNFLIKTKYTQTFVESYIHNYWVRNYHQDILEADFDVIVVGSDQIWSHIHAGQIGGVSNAYLPYLPDCVQRFSYAASFGKDIWEYTPKEEFVSREAVKLFKAVSVREASGVDMCRDHLNVSAAQHVDPTMLLDKDDYIKGLKIDLTPASDGEILDYLIDSSKEKDSIVAYIEQTLSCKTFKVNSRAEDASLKNISVEDCIQPPVEKWLRGFMDAEFIVTDSFHACVFSILFKKPFIVVGNMERGLARFQSLLGMFGLADRLVSSLEDIRSINLREGVDFCKVERIIQAERDKSITYLKAQLS